MLIDERIEALPVASVGKRLLDVTAACAVLVFTLPLLLLLSAIVALESPGPVLFRQRRTGLNGREFTILKFRTMRVVEDGETVVQATRNDARFTRVGHFLRRVSLDELPQLFNVLKGDMSLVGPRPHAVAHDRAWASAPRYYDRFRTRPGITGLAQMSGFRGEIRTLDDMEERIRLDNQYIDDWSLWSDIRILATTCVVVLFHKTAY